jgi:hypothetical protein
VENLRRDFRANDYSELESVRLSSAVNVTAAHTVQKFARSITNPWFATQKCVTFMPRLPSLTCLV